MIADYLGRVVVDPVFGVPQAYGGPDLVFAAYAYAAQIYCDFSGYTDIAIGLALLMGFIFPQNFHSPYRATGFRDFWRRWHMTLSRFLRDFLYIPLGGNRKGRLRTYVNLMATMLLGGLWHGAAWTFVLWGGVPRHDARAPSTRSAGGSASPGWLRWFVTFNLVVFGWILFRSPDLELFWTYVSGMTQPGSLTLLTVPALVALLVGDRPAAGAGADQPRGSRWGSSGSRRRSSLSPWPRLSSSSVRRCPARACPRSSTSASEMPLTPAPDSPPAATTA